MATRREGSAVRVCQRSLDNGRRGHPRDLLHSSHRLPVQSGGTEAAQSRRKPDRASGPSERGAESLTHRCRQILCARRRPVAAVRIRCYNRRHSLGTRPSAHPQLLALVHARRCGDLRSLEPSAGLPGAASSVLASGQGSFEPQPHYRGTMSGSRSWCGEPRLLERPAVERGV